MVLYQHMFDYMIQVHVQIDKRIYSVENRYIKLRYKSHKQYIYIAISSYQLTKKRHTLCQLWHSR